MIESVEHLHADKGHGVRLLGDRSHDDALLDPVEGFLIGVHRDHHFPGHMITVEHARDFLAGLRFEAYEGVDLVTLLANDLRRGIESDAWVALNIYNAGNLDSRRLGQRFFVTA